MTQQEGSASRESKVNSKIELGTSPIFVHARHDGGVRSAGEQSLYR